jgi:hypothetical protein
MRSLRLGQSLAVAVALSLTLLLVGVLTLGAIRLGVVVPPDLDIWLGGIHIVASITDPHECRLALPCPGPYRDYYVVWVYYKTAPDDVGEDGGRILVVPLRH